MTTLKELQQKLNEAKENFMNALKNTDIPIEERYGYWCDNVAESDRTAMYLSDLNDTGLAPLVDENKCNLCDDIPRHFAFDLMYRILEVIFELEEDSENIADWNYGTYEYIKENFDGDYEACKKYFMEESMKCGYTHVLVDW